MVHQQVEGGRVNKKKVNYLVPALITIDPGQSGGICAMFDDKLIAHKCPKTPKEMFEITQKLQWTCKSNGFPVLGIIEKVHAFPTDARSSAFKFGKNFGIWIGILESLSIKYEMVTPQKWQKQFELPKNKQQRKKELKMIAKEFYPKATLYTADAICIGLWGKNNGLI
tara:strand:- start:18225 stop:18728 length:504 start_codon:yes stop_codon:yes gene_type:complete